jgi:hypothetical protein
MYLVLVWGKDDRGKYAGSWDPIVKICCVSWSEQKKKQETFFFLMLLFFTYWGLWRMEDEKPMIT